MVGNFPLDMQDVDDGPFVGFGPQPRLFRSIHQLRDDPDPLAGPADASLEQIVDAELPPDLRR
jgi:hypothetical protein